MSYHLSEINKSANFTLIDYMEESVKLSNDINQDNLNRFSIKQGDIYSLDFSDNSFDFVFCWQTLSWIDNPKEALLELLRVTKKGGKIYLSSLFNLSHDVDLYSKVYDYTRDSGRNKISLNYNTYSQYTINEWLKGKAENFKIHPFKTNIEFDYKGKGLGTFTKKCEAEMIQISAGMLMNWGILEIKK